MGTDLESRNKVKAGLKKKLWLIQSSELAGKACIMLWHTLFKSRWSYGHQLLTTIDKKFREWIKSRYYEGIKTLFGIKQNPEKEAILRCGLGQPWECWQSAQNRKHFDKLKIKRDP